MRRKDDVIGAGDLSLDAPCRIALTMPGIRRLPRATRSVPNEMGDLIHRTADWSLVACEASDKSVQPVLAD
ncbi:hypothetical protein [Planctomycetes bacterium Pan216]|uniref:hypothetical protein n=1 Tax=Kolteria novifilia TaxID=2527975 RepID=UPI0011A43120